VAEEKVGEGMARVYYNPHTSAVKLRDAAGMQPHSPGLRPESFIRATRRSGSLGATGQ